VTIPKMKIVTQMMLAANGERLLTGMSAAGEKLGKGHSFKDLDC